MKARNILKSSILSLFVVSLSLAKPVYVYGPGGPYPAIKKAAKVFNKDYKEDVRVIAGPPNKWKEDAIKNADIIYSGSENMMTDFISMMPNLIDQKTIYPAYLRPAVILVHKGNPLHIHSFYDLLRPGISVMVVQGAGQTGLWEDIAGRDGNIDIIRKLRKNIVFYAPNSAVALKKWMSKSSPDAWIIYNIWQIAHPNAGQIINLDKNHVIYRDMDISLTYKGEKNKVAREFYKFLISKEGKKIFKEFGWSEKAKR